MHMDNLEIPSVNDIIKLIREDIRAPRHAYYRDENPEKRWKMHLQNNSQRNLGKLT